MTSQTIHLQVDYFLSENNGVVAASAASVVVDDVAAAAAIADVFVFQALS